MAELYLLDTNVLVHFIRKSPKGQAVEAKYGLLSTQIVSQICIVTAGELQSLALQWNWGPAPLIRLNNLLMRLAQVPLDYPGLIDAYAAIDSWSLSRGRRMGKNDLWIAAAAAVTGAQLLTTDSDFDYLDGTFLNRERV
ncbi:type II toxin-antitoxin system VapC family toxin [Gloeobacter morelensis]|uniref:Type II toxin-antitoxin system VapC family toxin n=1 Tax=Gloeobacter morelensis MG652769 TaxID=2781736 RepID=A0ABY3PMZ9_9CYAN|nr:type II toxin-antitoxin system VapC family toxin [Gloeobacter morelensis]UFP95066.1 type II toxin-antitoxin system VapC family toxin [Gloeobacter morelensis MG652769]